ncbi:hypothetical protein AMS62_08730 [Bacillus sp. FJAT-18019]|nr:hypothetical protein AMS62_08730 [Bacillus sp. FJAT-18019]
MITLVPEAEADYLITNPKSIYKGRKGRLRAILAKHGVRSREELKAYLEAVISGEDRTHFEQLYSQFVLLTEANRSARIETESDPQLKYKMKVVQKYIMRIPMGGVRALDYSYALFYCFIGARLRWLNRKEKWLYTGKLVSLAKSNYSDWYEYCMGFVVGLEFHSQDLAEDYVHAKTYRIMRLLNSADSPMVKLKL